MQNGSNKGGKMRQRRARKCQFASMRALSAGAALSAVLVAEVAHGQAVSPVTVTPQSLAPEHRDSGMRVEIPETGALHPPAGAERLSVALGDVRVEGGFAEVAAQTEAVAQSLRGKQVTLAQIYAAASEIEAIHARAGYVLARVSVPPQELASGAILRIAVTDGFVEGVDVSGLPRRVRAPVKARVATLVGKHHVTLHQIEQALLIAGDTPGLVLRSTLMRGSQPGGTRIVLEGSQHLLQGSIGVDNGLDPSLGRSEVNLQLALNSALGLGEQIYGFASSGYRVDKLFGSAPRERVVGGGVILPLGDGRFSLNPEATVARTLPSPAFGAPQSVGNLRRLTLRANATLVHTRSEQAGLSLAVEQIDETNKIPAFATLISHDRYMVVRPGASWNITTPAGAAYGATLQYSKGLGGLGAITAADATTSGVPFSRVGSGTRFAKLTASAHAAWVIGDGFGFALSARAQTSFGKAVFRAEQFALEGPDGLSAYVGGRTAVDAGFVERTEFSKHLETPGGPAAPISGVTPYLFSAFGAGKIESPTALERAHVTVFNMGAGLRATLFRHISLSGEYAHGFADVGKGGAGAQYVNALRQTDRVNVSASLRF